MLIFTRRIGEAVVIGDNEVNVTIIGVKGNQVRLGFLGAKEIPIHRHEIYNRIQLEKNQTTFEEASSIDESIIGQLEANYKKPENREISH